MSSTISTQPLAAARDRHAARPPAGPARAEPVSTRCSSRSWRTSATSPGSPARRRCCSSRATDARFVTDGRYTQAVGRGARRGRRRRAQIEIGLTGAAQREILVARGQRRIPARARGAQRHAGPQQLELRDGVRRRRARARGRARRGPAPGEGRGRDRSHPARVRDRRRRVPGAAPDARRRARPSSEFALALEFAMRERGASGNSFDPIIASGPNGAKPHHVPSERVIERNELDRLRLRLHRRRLLLRHDPHRVRRRSRPRCRATSTTWCCRASRRAAAAVAVDVACAEVDRACARRHRRRRLGRGVLALDRPRCRPRDPRGAPGGRDGR